MVSIEEALECVEKMHDNADMNYFREVYARCIEALKFQQAFDRYEEEHKSK